MGQKFPKYLHRLGISTHYILLYILSITALKESILIKILCRKMNINLLGYLTSLYHQECTDSSGLPN